MKRLEDKLTIEQFKKVIDVLNPCMDDYLYIYDIKNDHYCISPNAMMRFKLPSSEFTDVVEMHGRFTYPDDIVLLQEDLNKIIRKESNFHNMQYRWLDKSGKAVWINCRGSVLYDELGEPEYLVGCINEIGRKQRADNVSGLLGETSLQNEFQRHQDEEVKGFILRIGIDNFKEINENKGIEYGDMVIRKTADCIESVILPGQHIYRIVADEFIVADFNGRNAESAIELYNRIHDRVKEFIESNCYEVFYTVSAGILDFTAVTKIVYANVMKLSEFALNEAKERGKNRYYVYANEDYELFIQKKELLRQLRNSVNHNFDGFETHFQPIADIRNKCLGSAEILLRYSSEDTGAISPMQFIPLLEESGLIIPVGKWVLNEAVKTCLEIRKKIPDFRVSINVSYVQVLKSDILNDILETIEKYSLDASGIMIELTESGFLDANENFIAFYEGLKKHNIALALDDFGTGYSNFRYLAEIYPHAIKIDRSFTLKALNNEYEYRLLQHMVNMSHSVDLKLCIEGIETKDELEKICGINPDYIQGYLFGKPCNYENFHEKYIKEKALN